MKGKTLTARGVIGIYLGAPVMYIDSPDQVKVADSTVAQNPALKLRVILPDKIYFEHTLDQEISIQNLSDRGVSNIILYESGTQFLMSGGCGDHYQGGAIVKVGDLAPGESTNLKCTSTIFAQYNVPVQPGQHVPIELSCDSSDSYGQFLAMITLTLDPTASYFYVEISYDKPEWR
jgi:hypothetical protein